MSDVELEPTEPQEPSGTDPETTPEVVPEPAPEPQVETSWRDDPEYQALVARQAELEDRLAQYETPRQETPNLDLNDFLNPLGDNFGENLARFLSDRDQYIAGMLDQRLEPLTAREQKAAEDAGKAAMAQLIGDQWNESTDGKLGDNTQKVIGDLSGVYLAEENQRLGVRVGPDGVGQGPLAQVAARNAITRATQTIRDMNRAQFQGGGQANVDALAAVQQLPGEIKAGAPGVDVADAPKTPAELMEKYFGKGSGALVGL